ncbi:hypothetical protein Gohar_015834 [Gossypium harknessii]|uniref:DUF4283 domain-containing protein n=1 Tax=Gossypium harknessii TaxID=34285 RepID=A0A7J9G102_9ROSI|nr:hypothetical protein [Gossypium harknessii]
MYRGLKYLWFTKESVSFVAMTAGQAVEDYAFNITPSWIRVYNISFEQMDRQVAIDVGEAMGEIVAIDWRDRKGGPNQNRGNWQNGAEILEKGKEKVRAGEEESESCSPTDKRPIRSSRDGGGRVKFKRKRIKGSNGGE